MQSNISIGPSFSGSIGVKIVKDIKNNVPVFDRQKIYATSPEQDYDMVMIVGKSLQSDKSHISDGVKDLFAYVNNLNLVDTQSKIKLKLPIPDGKDFRMSIVGTHVVVRKDNPTIGDANLDLHLDILS